MCSINKYLCYSKISFNMQFFKLFNRFTWKKYILLYGRPRIKIR